MLSMKKMMRVFILVIFFSVSISAGSSCSSTAQKLKTIESIQKSNIETTSDLEQKSSLNSKTENDQTGTETTGATRPETKVSTETEAPTQTQTRTQTNETNPQDDSKFGELPQEPDELWNYFEQNEWKDYSLDETPNITTLLHSIGEGLLFVQFYDNSSDEYYDPAVSPPDLADFPFTKIKDGTLLLEKEKLSKENIVDLMHLIIVYRCYPLINYGEADEPMYSLVGIAEIRHAVRYAFLLDEDVNAEVIEEFFNQEIISATSDENLVKTGGVGGIFGTQFYPQTVQVSSDGILRVTGCVMNFEFKNYAYPFEAYFTPNPWSIWDGYTLNTIRLTNIDADGKWRIDKSVVDLLSDDK
ncbi:MAG TPA: hypothetical protein GXZ76_03230 [Clostridiaceae bacterium]|nr:hypothetical protein [Clostridiaceae bacterium]